MHIRVPLGRYETQDVPGVLLQPEKRSHLARFTSCEA